VVSSTPRPHLTSGKDPVPILQEAGWDPGQVWTGGKSRSHRDSIPNRPARSQSLYRLSYPAYTIKYSKTINRIAHCMLSVKYYVFRLITEFSNNVLRLLLSRFSQICGKRLLASSCLSVRPPVRQSAGNKLGSNWTDFHEI